MIITALTPNIDSFLFVELEDEHRKKRRFPIVLFAAIGSNPGDMSIGLVINKDGVLAMPIGNVKVVRDESNHKPPADSPEPLFGVK